MTTTNTGAPSTLGGNPMSSVFWCMFWGAMIFVILSIFFWVSVYAASALDDMKKTLGVWRHD